VVNLEKKFMGITEKLQRKKEKMEQEVRARIEEFNSLVSVYLQASFASQLGILDLRMLPQLKIFKHKFNLMTQGRLGNAEKAFVSKLMINEYKLTEEFFKEIDASVKRVCKRQQDMQTYSIYFQNLSQNLFLSVASEMQWSLRLPAFFRSLIKSSMKDAVHKVLTGSDFKAGDARKAAIVVRELSNKMKLSENWLFQYAYPVLMLSKGAKIK
jgi:hypothetical protein